MKVELAQMTPAAISGRDGVLVAVSPRCPFFDPAVKSCHIAAAATAARKLRESLCCSEDYDDCPRYLGYLLRRTRPLRTDSDWLDAV